MDSREASFKIICLNLKFQGRNFRHLNGVAFGGGEREFYPHRWPCSESTGFFSKLWWHNELTWFAKSIGFGGQSDIVGENKQSKTDEKDREWA